MCISNRIGISSRHEKRCRMLERLFCLFQCSKNQQCAGPPDFVDIEKRTEAEIENLILVHPDFWTFHRLCHYEISLF